MLERSYMPQYIKYPPYIHDVNYMFIMEIGLNPYELSVFLRILHYEYVFEQCTATEETLATDCKCSIGKVSDAKKSLEEKSLISIYKVKANSNDYQRDVMNTFFTVESLNKRLHQLYGNRKNM